MVVNKFVSVKEIINDVFRNTGTSEDLPIYDLVYWSFESLQLMRQPAQYLKKVTGYESSPNLDITNYKAKLPCDLYKVVQIAVNGLPARYAGNSFHHLLDGECCGITASNSTIDLFVDNFGNTFSPQSSALVGTNHSNDIVTFDINDDYLTLSVREGKVCIAYLAIPTDSEGYPMIPDDMSYRVAVRNYLTMKIAYINWIKDPSNRGKQAIFEHADKEWCWYVGQATTTMKVPDISEMESLKNQMMRMIPKTNEFSTFFKSLGAAEQKKIK